MGFGSYDESEQENQNVDADADAAGEAVDLHDNDHEGEVTYDAEASTDALLDQLADIKAARAEKDEKD